MKWLFECKTVAGPDRFASRPAPTCWPPIFGRSPAQTFTAPRRGIAPRHPSADRAAPGYRASPAPARRIFLRPQHVQLADHRHTRCAITDCDGDDCCGIMAPMGRVIDTDRRILRRFMLDDRQAFYRPVSRPEILRCARSTPVASLEDAKELRKAAPFHDHATTGHGRFAWVGKESGELTGFGGPRYVPEINDPEPGCRFLSRFRGIGLATAAGQASIDSDRRAQSAGPRGQLIP